MFQISHFASFDVNQWHLKCSFLRVLHSQGQVISRESEPCDTAIYAQADTLESWREIAKVGVIESASNGFLRVSFHRKFSFSDCLLEQWYRVCRFDVFHVRLWMCIRHPQRKHWIRAHLKGLLHVSLRRTHDWNGHCSSKTKLSAPLLSVWRIIGFCAMWSWRVAQIRSSLWCALCS